MQFLLDNFVASNWLTKVQLKINASKPNHRKGETNIAIFEALIAHILFA